MPWEDVAVKAVHEFDTTPETEAKARHAVREHQSKNVINRELVALFPVLRRAGLKVAILSNAGTHLRQKLADEGIAPLVDEIIISGEIGHQKPHKEAFQALFDKLGLPPEHVAFVDDTPKSLEKAAEIGYVPILFRGNQKLMADLKGLGILTE